MFYTYIIGIMITQQLIEYVRQRVATGTARDVLTKELLAVGWGADDLDKVFASPEVGMGRGQGVTQPKVSAEARPGEPAKNIHMDIQKPFTENTVSSDSSPMSEQTAESFVPSASLVSAQPPATRDSFWYRPIVIILALVILMGIAGGGVYAYYAYTKQPSAISVLRGVLEHTATIQSFDFAATSTSATAANIASSSLGVETHGILSGAKFIYATTTIAEHGTIVLGKAGGHPNFDIITALQSTISVATTSGTYSLGLHAILSPKALDLNLLRGKVSIESTSPQLRMGAVFVNAALAKISDKWVRVIDFANASSSQQISKIFSGLSASSSPVIAKDIKDLRAYADSMQYIHSARNVGTEYVGGIPTYHLSLVIQNTPQSVLLVQRFIYDYIHLLRTRDGAMGQNISFATFLQKSVGFSETFTQKIPVNIWVGKNNSRVYKFTIPSIAFVEVGDNQNNSVMLNEKFRFTHYNATTPIVVPQKSEPLKSFLGGLLGVSSGSGL